MAKFTNLTQNFTMIPNWLINNQNVSLKAKGLFIFLASKPNNFNFSAEGLSKLNKEGITSIKNCLKELENTGLLKRKKIKDNNNRFIGIEYILTDNPLDEKADGGKPTDGKPNVGKPTNINNKDLLKKDLYKKDNTIEYNNTVISKNEAFNVFWDLYGKKQDKAKCEQKFLKLSKKEIENILLVIKDYVISTPEVKYRKNPLTWLNGKCWEDEIIQTNDSVINKPIEELTIDEKLALMRKPYS